VLNVHSKEMRIRNHGNSHLPLNLVVWAVLLSSVISLLGCGQTETKAPEAAEQRYTLNGKVLSLDAQAMTATIDHEAIEGWMEAMTMPYPIQDQADFDKLHAGDSITATVFVGSDGGFRLGEIKVVEPAAAEEQMPANPEH
jgi:protein SCO1